MVPRQDLFHGRLSIIRPLAYLNKDHVSQIAANLQLEPVRVRCPLSEKTRRLDIRNILADLYEKIPDAKQHIFAALGNVRNEYLLSPVNRKRQEKGCKSAD